MRRKKLFRTELCLVLALGTLLLPVRAGQRPVKVLIAGEVPAARLLTEEEKPIQDLVFDRQGQAVAGPLTPGRYRIRSEEWEAAFTVRPNGAISRAEGEAWTDGEILHLGAETTGRLTIRYDGDWRWTLSGENADEARPSLDRGAEGMVCVFDRLPLGYYVLEGPEGGWPILLTGENAEQILDLRHKEYPDISPLG